MREDRRKANMERVVARQQAIRAGKDLSAEEINEVSGGGLTYVPPKAGTGNIASDQGIYVND